MEHSGMKKLLKVGIIGAGQRAGSYFHNLTPELDQKICITAIADPSPERREIFAHTLARGQTVRFYDAGAALLEHEELDALIIGSPNHIHTDDAVAAMARGMPLLLEKPVAINLDQCRRLWHAYQSHGQPPIFVGFALRYTPFMSRIKSLLNEQELGQILTLDLDENIHSNVTSMFFRGWRRWDRLSGGFMVEKCCHDFDVLNWLTQARAVRVFSMAKRSHFTPRPRAEQQPRFDSTAMQEAALDYSSPVKQAQARDLSTESIYDIEGDVPDHQAVMIEFDNGILTNFTACHAQPRNTRRLRICGAAGALEGDIERSLIRLDQFEGRGCDITSREIEVKADHGGHHGGDAPLKQAFWEAAAGRGDPEACRAGIVQGIEAVLVGLAAEESKRTGRSVEIEPWRRQIFESPS
jgi:predicted dehydrogenase